jgi:hypothetical protein
MKNFTLFLFALLFCGIMNAQTSKGSFCIGFHNFSPGPLASYGTPYNLFPQTNAFGITFGTIKNKFNGTVSDNKETTSVIGLSLNSQYFVEDQIAVGLTASFSTATSIEKGSGDDFKVSSTILLIGPEMRYYMETGEKARFWLKGVASFGSTAMKYDGEKSDPTNLFQYGVGAGISIFPVSSVAFDFGIGYNVLTATIKESTDVSKLISSGLTLDVGVSVFL